MISVDRGGGGVSPEGVARRFPFRENVNQLETPEDFFPPTEWFPKEPQVEVSISYRALAEGRNRLLRIREYFKELQQSGHPQGLDSKLGRIQ